MLSMFFSCWRAASFLLLALPAACMCTGKFEVDCVNLIAAGEQVASVDAGLAYLVIDGLSCKQGDKLQHQAPLGGCHLCWEVSYRRLQAPNGSQVAGNCGAAMLWPNAGQSRIWKRQLAGLDIDARGLCWLTSPYQCFGIQLQIDTSL